jgi:hypothetical protein
VQSLHFQLIIFSYITPVFSFMPISIRTLKRSLFRRQKLHLMLWTKYAAAKTRFSGGNIKVMLCAGIQKRGMVFTKTKKNHTLPVNFGNHVRQFNISERYAFTTGKVNIGVTLSS